MKVSLGWLKELIDIKEDANTLAEMLTRGGIEVGSVEHLDAGFEKVVVGEISQMEKHPNADRLWVCQVNTGQEMLNIVTGAQNLQVGDKIPVALIGSTLPNGVHIKSSKLRGIASQGMLCSTEELMLDDSAGLERSKGGIMILGPETSVGEQVAKVLGRQDSILDLELYPNRPDCLAMVNVAREVSSLTGQKVNLPKWAAEEEAVRSLTALESLGVNLEQKNVQVVIDEPELCFRYAGLMVDDVQIAPSPEWMQRRLQAAGVRPINNIVDITNYCMLEMGQPLHAFDRDQITGAIHVRRAYPGERLVTLDNVERKLDPEMLLIADDERALALAGVMGGLESEVTTETERLLIESAHFAPVSIRRTSRRLGLRSEASNRFEKGINTHAIVATLGRVSELLIELKAGRPVGIIDNTVKLPVLPQIRLSVSRAGAVLGYQATEEDIHFVLKRLGFNYRVEGQEFIVDIPSYRSDLQIEEDLIEEVARIIGYDKIPTTLPAGAQTQGRRTDEQEFRRRLRHLLVGLGMDEVLTYSFASSEADEKWGDKDKAISLLNPLREELRGMRTSLLPGLLEVVGRNVSRRNTDLNIFEIGNVYLSSERPLLSLPQEMMRIAGVAIGKTGRHWLTPQINYDFYYLKGILEEISKEFTLKLTFKALEESPLLHPGRSATVYLGQVQLGIIGEVHPGMEKELGLERVVVFEIDLAPLLENWLKVTGIKPIPRFPAVQRDLAIVASKETTAESVMRSIRKLGGELLQQVDIFDVYTGKSIPEDKKSLAFTLRYQSLERTLKDEEVNELNSRILAGIEQEFAVEWRK